MVYVWLIALSVLILTAVFLLNNATLFDACDNLNLLFLKYSYLFKEIMVRLRTFLSTLNYNCRVPNNYKCTGGGVPAAHFVHVRFLVRTVSHLKCWPFRQFYLHIMLSGVFFYRYTIYSQLFSWKLLPCTPFVELTSKSARTNFVESL